MKAYDPSKPLIYIHIPKAAGVSVRQIFDRWFNVKPHYFHERKNRMPKKHRLKRLIGSGYRRNLCIYGHFNRDRGFGLDQYYPEIDQLATVVRDPFQLALSNYFYGKKEAELYGDRYRSGEVVRIEDRYEDIRDYLLGG